MMKNQILSGNSMQGYLQETEYFNFSHPLISEMASKVTGNNDKERAVSIYYLVRDQIHYNPYTVKDGIASLKASYGLEKGQGFCIPKSALMVALCRYFGIPARLGLADVKNHLSSQKLLDWLGTDVFTMHGYAEIYLDEKWLKTTPVFDQKLCRRFGIDTLEFNGENDAIFQPFTENGDRHMEYLKDHGSFEDIPVAFIFENLNAHYPHLMSDLHGFDSSESLEQDIA